MTFYKNLRLALVIKAMIYLKSDLTYVGTLLHTFGHAQEGILQVVFHYFINLIAALGEGLICDVQEDSVNVYSKCHEDQKEGSHILVVFESIVSIGRQFSSKHHLTLSVRIIIVSTSSTVTPPTFQELIPVYLVLSILYLHS